jgi:hypothetical protein
MKKQYLAILFALICVLGLGLSARAQEEDTVITKVPFDFVAGGKVLPAGKYTLGRSRHSLSHGWRQQPTEFFPWREHHRCLRQPYTCGCREQSRFLSESLAAQRNHYPGRFDQSHDQCKRGWRFQRSDFA